MGIGRSTKVDVCSHVVIRIKFRIFFSIGCFVIDGLLLSFPWVQKRHFFDVLLLAGASFRISQMRISEAFMSLRCRMCADNDVLVE